jgi:hypothetical protein
MKPYLCFLWLALTLGSCTNPQSAPAPVAPLKTITLDSTVKLAAGQTVYVPIYSQIYTVEQRRTIDLTATLSLRNTDLTQPIIITSVNYFNSRGEQVRKYLEQPVELNPLAATEFVVDQQDASGGTGAAFVVEWVAQTPVSTPVIEAVMIHTLGNQGLSFVSQGRVIKNR